MVVEGINRAIHEARILNKIQGVRIGRIEQLTHLLFVDDVLLFCYCMEVEGRQYKEILDLFCDATSMLVNVNKSALYFPVVEARIRCILIDVFSFPSYKLVDGFKYLGYMHKT
jgi:hypothetical protein